MTTNPTQTPSHIIATTIQQLHGIGTALTDCATRLAEMRELLPTRGDLVEEFNELCTVLAWIHTAYRDTDEALLNAYQELAHAERCAAEGWTPLPLHTNGNEPTP